MTRTGNKKFSAPPGATKYELQKATSEYVKARNKQQTTTKVKKALSDAQVPERHLNMTNDLFDRDRFNKMKMEADILRDEIKKGTGELEIFPELMQDTFTSLFRSSPVMKDPADVDPIYHLNRNIIGNIMESSDWDQLRNYTRLDEVQSAAAAATLGDMVLSTNPEEIQKIQAYLKQLREDAAKLKEINKDIAQMQQVIMNPPPDMTPQAIKQLQQKVEKLQEKAQQTQQKIDQCQGSIAVAGQNIGAAGAGTAITAATQVTQMQETFFSGWGTGAGNAQPTSYKDRLALAQAIMKKPMLMKLAQLAGRFSKLAVHKQKNKTKHAVEEVSDVVRSNDLSRILPVSAMYLADPDTEDLFYVQYAEGSLLTYELAGHETKTKGPIILCTDISGSMSESLDIVEGGDQNMNKDLWAKAIALALVQVAKRENRSAAVIPFDSNVKQVFRFLRNEPFKTDEFLAMASLYTGGGTDFNPPLKEAIKILEEESEFKKADVLVITDGEGPISDNLVRKILNLKKKLQFSVYVVVVGYEFDWLEHSLKKISDHLIPVQALTVDVAADLFEAV